MAKKTDVKAGDSALGDFAEELGAFLGNTERKASAWLAQRKTVAAQLTAIRDKASTLLAQLGAGEVGVPKKAAKPVGSAVPAAVARTKGTSKSSKRVISAETRAKMADAARRRWAAKSQGRAR